MRAGLILAGVAALCAAYLAAASWLFWVISGITDQIAYSPWLILLYAPYWDSHPDLAANFILACGVPLLAIGVLIWRLWSLLGGVSLYGRAKWAGLKDIVWSGLRLSLRPRRETLILGKWMGLYVGLPGNEHVLVYARTGAGKGVSYVMPNCFNYGDSLVVLDIKGENWARTARHRSVMLCQRVFKFDPLNPDGITHRWNPFGGISRDRSDYVSKLHHLAYDFFPEVMGKDKFWQDSARSAFLGISVLLCETEGAELHPGSVFRFFAADGRARVKAMVEARRAMRIPYSQTCVELLADYFSGTHEVVSGVRKHVTSTMGLWFNPRVVAATSESDFDLAKLRRLKMSVYLCVSPAEIGQLGPLLRLFFNRLYQQNTDVLPEHDPSIRHRVHVLMDEFTAIPAMTAFAKATGFARGYGMHFSFVVQSKSQIIEGYRDQGQASLLENVGAEVVFGTDDPAVCREASERAGADTVAAETKSGPRFWRWAQVHKQTANTHDHRRPLILPQEIARMDPEREIVFRYGAPPMLLRKLHWFRDRAFRDLAYPAPRVPYRGDVVMLPDDGRTDLVIAKGRE